MSMNAGSGRFSLAVAAAAAAVVALAQLWVSGAFQDETVFGPSFALTAY